MIFVNCFIIFAIAFFLFCFGMMYYRYVKWRNSMLAQGRWKPWKEVRSELCLGRGVLYIDFGGGDTKSWWIPIPTSNDPSVVEAWEAGFATFCPYWYRFEFLFRIAFPNAKLYQSFDTHFS